MTSVAMGSSELLENQVMQQMYEFRNEVFVRRLGWSLPVADGRERDKYDTPEARYLVISNDSQEITGCARLIPTTGEYMLPELFSELLGGGDAPRDPAIWELSRFATDVRRTKAGRILSLSEPTLDLLGSVFELARGNQVERLILVTSIGIERLILRAELDAHRIGPPARVDGNLCVALFIEVPPRTSVEDRERTAFPGGGSEVAKSRLPSSERAGTQGGSNGRGFPKHQAHVELEARG